MELCRNNPYFVATILTLSQHKGIKIEDGLYRDKRQQCHDRKWQGYNTSQLRQLFLYYDKVSSMVPAQGRIFCCDITFKVHNEEQQDLVVTKIIYVATKKFISRQEVGEQYKRNVATKKSCCDIMKN